VVQLFVYNLSNLSVWACLKRYRTLWDSTLNFFLLLCLFSGMYSCNYGSGEYEWKIRWNHLNVRNAPCPRFIFPSIRAPTWGITAKKGEFNKCKGSSGLLSDARLGKEDPILYIFAHGWTGGHMTSTKAVCNIYVWFDSSPRVISQYRIEQKVARWTLQID